MNIAIATGLPGGGWDEVLPLLLQAGFETPDENLIRWQDELMPAAAAGDARRPFEPLQAGPEQADNVRAVLAHAAQPMLLADGRGLCLLDFWAAHFPRARFLLLYASPETVLSRMLARGENPAEFLATWQSASQIMLQFQRRHRQRALLLDAEALALQPQAFAEACKCLDILPRPLPGQPAEDWAGPPMARLLAAHMAASCPELQFLKAELEASALPLRTAEAAGPTPSAEAFADDYLRMQATERELRQRLEAAAGQLQAELERSAQSRQVLEAAHRDAMHEGELLLLQVHQLQEELAECTSRAQETARQLEIRNEELQALRQRMAAAPRKRPSPLDELVRWVGGMFGGRDGEQGKIMQQARLIERSGLFDRAWYIAENADVRREGIDPIRHYLMHGAAEGRNPSATFHTRYYLETCPDVAATGMNPLIHYIKFGKTEGRQTSPFRNAA